MENNISQKIVNTTKKMIPWNKGKIGIYSIKTLEKMSERHKGIKSL